MIWKFVRAARATAAAMTRRRFNSIQLLEPKTSRVEVVRCKFFGLIPPDQYDVPIPKKLRPFYAMRVYWEIIPLVFIVAFVLFLCTSIIIYSCKNKVDVVFSTHNRDCNSRLMDLRNPVVYKLVTINQRYEPWPEMQNVLDKMVDAEKRALSRATNCSHP